MKAPSTLERLYKVENFKIAVIFVGLVLLVELVMIISFAQLAVFNHFRLPPLFAVIPALFTAPTTAGCLFIVQRKPTQEIRDHFAQTGELPAKAKRGQYVWWIGISIFAIDFLIVAGFFYVQIQHLRHWPGY